MATNLALDDSLIRQAQAIGKHRSKKEAVTAALQEYVRRRKRVGIIELFGKVPYDPAYNYKERRKAK